MNKKRLNYKKYFLNLVSFIKSSNFSFLYNIPELFIRDFRKDKSNNNKFISNFFQGIFDRNIYFKNPNFLENSKICFISHYVGATNRKNLDYDFYFGNLFKILIKENIKFSVILINHTDEKIIDIYKKYKKSKLNRVIINNNFNALRDYKILLYIFLKYLEFKLFKTNNNKNLKELIKFKISLNLKFFLSSKNTIKLTRNIIKTLNKMTNLQNLITTYEGHAFERILFNYCRKKNIKSFGYFFSVIRNFKNSIYYNINKNYTPNVVFTSGRVISNNLIKNIKKTSKHIYTLGSSKNLRKSKIKLLKNKNKKKLKVLVCPEGLYTETKLMMNLVSGLKRNNNIEYIFRTHPVIDKSVLKKENYFYKNIKFSNNKNIRKDFDICDVVLYSGSSVCIQAVLYGLAPIYYHNINYEFSLDPIYEVNKFVVKNKNSLDRILNYFILNKNNKTLKKKLINIQNYCSDYFEKLNFKILLNTLKKNEK